MEYYRSQVLICSGTGCSSSNSPAIIKRFEECIRNAGLENEITVVRTGCFGLSALSSAIPHMRPRGRLKGSFSAYFRS